MAWYDVVSQGVNEYVAASDNKKPGFWGVLSSAIFAPPVEPIDLSNIQGEDISKGEFTLILLLIGALLSFSLIAVYSLRNK